MKSIGLKIGVVVALLAGALALVGCQAQDVVAKYSVTSFGTLVGALDKQSLVADGTTITSPDGTSHFAPSADALTLTTDVAPFVAAGLDVTKAPAGFTVDGAQLKLVKELKTGKGGSVDATDAESVMKSVVTNNRDLLGFHVALDHFGLMVGDGSMFEWAKTASTNDKDIVWVLNPEPFIDAGVDVANVEGWVFAEVEIMKDGKKVKVDKLLKPFDVIK